MIKSVKAFKAKWVGANSISITVNHPDGSITQLLIDLKDFTVSSTDEASVAPTAVGEDVITEEVKSDD